ncbi:MAG: beta-lactamase family protein [Acidobacteria bacterium]|nr:beta-lactamase family protein [Acidobacteriota bacterium]
MTTEPSISGFLLEPIAAGDFPSAVYLVAEEGEIVFHGAVGNAVVEPEIIPARTDTIYDVASMTKVLVTGLLMAMFVERGELRTVDAVSRYLSEFGHDDKRGISIAQLLSHTSGLPAWRPFYLLDPDPGNVLKEIGRLPTDENAAPVTYSDPNFITLGKIVEKMSGVSLREGFESMIAKPLRLLDTRFGPIGKNDLPRTAASETGNGFEKQTCIEQGYLDNKMDNADVFRDEVIWGEVHDGNAYFMGEVGGHAGLFSTAKEIFKIALQFLPNYTQLLKPQTCELFRTNLTPGQNEHRSFAFQLGSSPESTGGSPLSPQSFGHLGFTGTSLWIDPIEDRVFILLTNRTHHRKLPFANINAVRRQFHQLAVEALCQKT